MEHGDRVRALSFESESKKRRTRKGLSTHSIICHLFSAVYRVENNCNSGIAIFIRMPFEAPFWRPDSGRFTR